MKKLTAVILSAVCALSLAACTQEQQSSTSTSESEVKNNAPITVISREAGSGTRAAFVELTGVEAKDADGNKVDHTTVEAVFASKTDVVLTNVASDENSIGYVSMGSLNDTVKALKVDGVEATKENVKAGTYSIARPFNIATKGEGSERTQDFIKFIMSKQGQEIVGKSYIPVKDDAEEYTASGIKGKIAVSGSSSVSPVMEKLIEAYTALNPDVEITLNTTDSTNGMKDAMSGVSDIGMASRDLKDAEKAELTGTTIAMDGIAVIVNTRNAVEDLSVEQIRQIYTGETTTWGQIG